jgi:hypothetical protein
VCPLMRLVPGVRGNTSGDRRWSDPVWKSTAIPPLPRPLPLAVSPAIVAGVMAQRQPKQPRFKSALPPQLAAVNLHAAGIDGGAEAHAERQRWTDPPGEGTSSERSTSTLTVHPAAPSILLVLVRDRHAAISPCRLPDYRTLHSEMPVKT